MAGIKSATITDTIITVLLNLGSSFPTTKAELQVELQPCCQCRGGLSVDERVCMYNDRVVIPPSLRTRVLQTLHSAHQVVLWMSMRVEQSVFWPGMSRDIRDMRSSCSTYHNIAPIQAHIPPVTPITPAVLSTYAYTRAAQVNKVQQGPNQQVPGRHRGGQV